ncbi:hypothetical protein [Citreimonas sp.]|uniref:hypothetical protein n=1 Tax=Citreimonas sp. TaxID=3036715 RepID=UPI0040595665
MFGLEIEYATFIASVVAAVAALGTAVVSLLLYRNDKRRMRRRQPTVELHSAMLAEPSVEGWSDRTLVVRNTTSVAIFVKGVSVRRWRKRYICSWQDAPREKDGQGGSAIVGPIAQRRRTVLRATVNPAGTKSMVGQSGDVLNAYVLVQGVKGARDLVLEWEWADGHR